jgi:hypothetical protein
MIKNSQREMVVRISDLTNAQMGNVLSIKKIANKNSANLENIIAQILVNARIQKEIAEEVHAQTQKLLVQVPDCVSMFTEIVLLRKIVV